MMAKRFLKYFFTGTAVLLLLCILLVVTFDPFYQYHKPLPGLKAVLTDKEYQCAGSLKNFDYDAVIAGSLYLKTTIITGSTKVLTAPPSRRSGLMALPQISAI